LALADSSPPGVEAPGTLIRETTVLNAIVDIVITLSEVSAFVKSSLGASGWPAGRVKRHFIAPLGD
jgi:hypothetical protein